LLTKLGANKDKLNAAQTACGFASKTNISNGKLRQPTEC